MNFYFIVSDSVTNVFIRVLFYLVHPLTPLATKYISSAYYMPDAGRVKIHQA